ncbi:MAG: MFS transporter [Ilumatobacteraceae bacterium]
MATGAPESGTGGVFRSLRYRNARLFFAGLAISNVGTWLQLTAMSLLVYRITDGDALIVGINAGLQFVPMLFLGAWAGAVADGHNRLRMSIITQSALAVQAIVLGLLDLTGAINVPVIFALSLLLGLVNAFDNPARRALVTELVEPAEIPNATSLNTAVMTGSRIFGPALAAVLVGAIGTAWCFLANGITFAAIIISLLMIRTSEMFTVPPRPRGGQPVREGLRWVTGRRDMAMVFGLLVVVSTFAFNYSVSLPKLADEQWGGEDNFGWVLAVTSIGSLTGSLLTARLRRVPLNWMLISMVVLGVGGIGMAWAPNLALAFAWSIPLGVGGAGFITAANAISQQESPSDMRSRLMALQAVAFLGSTPIGSPITGWIADTVSAPWSLAYGGVISLLCALGAWAYLSVRPLNPLPPVSAEMVAVGGTAAARD